MKLFTVIVLGSAAMLSADQYYQCEGPGCQGGYRGQPQQGQGYYQNQPQQGQGYYQQDQQRQNQGYYNQQQRMDTDMNNPKMQSADPEINQKVRDTIGSGWFSKGYQDVTYDVRNGVVTLRGTVNSNEDRQKVEDSVRKISGVTQVNNQIMVNNSRNATNANTTNYPSTTNTYSNTNPSTNTYSNTNMYTDTTNQTAGKNYPQDSATTNEDRQLNARIRDKLSNGWFSRSFETIILKTNNGIVTITGTVDKADDIQKVNDQINSVQGVRQVNNQLRQANR